MDSGLLPLCRSPHYIFFANPARPYHLYHRLAGLPPCFQLGGPSGHRKLGRGGEPGLRDNRNNPKRIIIQSLFLCYKSARSPPGLGSSNSKYTPCSQSHFIKTATSPVLWHQDVTERIIWGCPLGVPAVQDAPAAILFFRFSHL